VNSAYSDSVRSELEAEERLRAAALDEAFELIDHDRSGDISRHEMHAALEALKCYVHIGSAERCDSLFELVGADHSNGLSRPEFVALCTRLRMRWDSFAQSPETPSEHCLDRLAPGLTSSASWRAVATLVTSRRFDRLVDVILLANAVLLLLHELLRPEQTRQLDRLDSWYTILDLSFTALFTLEMLLKISVLGAATYAASMKNAFDGFVTCASLGMSIVVYCPNGFDDPSYLRYVLLLRLLRLFRLLAHIPAVAFIVSTFVAMVPPALVLTRVLLCVMYATSALGMQLFGGLINKDHSRPQFALLQSDLFGESLYWANNFNDLASGMVVCFELLVVNNWMVLASGFVAVTSLWARWFFIGYYFVAVLVFFNLFIAFAIEAYSDAAKEPLTDPPIAPATSVGDPTELGLKSGQAGADDLLRLQMEFDNHRALLEKEYAAKVAEVRRRCGKTL